MFEVKLKKRCVGVVLRGWVLLRKTYTSFTCGNSKPHLPTSTNAAVVHVANRQQQQLEINNDVQASEEDRTSM